MIVLVDISETRAFFTLLIQQLNKRQLFPNEYKSYITHLVNHAFKHKGGLEYLYTASVRYLIELGFTEEEALSIDVQMFRFLLSDITKGLNQLVFNPENVELLENQLLDKLTLRLS